MLLKKLYDKLVTKVNAIDTIDVSKFVKKADYNTKMVEIEKKNTWQ